jgi:AcrR family transcriptional regulator
MSKRNTADAFLDAARECVLAVGMSRTTFSDVARRAGVSRMTLYRHFPDVASLLSALMTRELAAVMLRAEGSVQSLRTARERLVEGSVRGAEMVADDPLFARIVDVDPQLLLPYVTDRLGETQRVALGYFERYLAAGREDGSIRGADPAAMSYALLIAGQSFVLSARVAEAEGVRSAAFDELRLLFDAYLRPARGPARRSA